MYGKMPMVGALPDAALPDVEPEPIAGKIPMVGALPDPALPDVEPVEPGPIDGSTPTPGLISQALDAIMQSGITPIPTPTQP